MSKVPHLSYEKIINALQQDHWFIVRHKGSHVRLQKRLADGQVFNLTVPTHRPVKRSTLAHILKQAQLTPEEFQELL